MPACFCTRCLAHRSILGVSETDDAETISRVHRDLVKVWHPDRFENDQRLRQKAEEQLKRIQEAYTGLREHVLNPATTESIPRPAGPTPPKHAAESVEAYTGTSPVYFSVGLVKLVVLSICTFGFYEIYWFYSNWKRLREITGQAYRPFWRALFSIFYCRPCFGIVRQTGESLGIPKPPAAGFLSVLWILTSLCWRLPDPYWLLSFTSVFYMLPIQAYATCINAREAPQHNRNTRFSGWNWLALVAGGIWFLLVVIAAFLPDAKGTKP